MSTTHEELHAALEAIYDGRHPDAPLPHYSTATHLQIHNLLNADANSVNPEDLPAVLPKGQGHMHDHNVVAAIYNEL
jgi:hypothetical protein